MALLIRLGQRIGRFVAQPGFGVRLVVGFVIAAAFVEGLKGLFAELGKTQDWVLECRNWIAGGSIFIAFVLWLGFVLITRPNEENSRS